MCGRYYIAEDDAAEELRQIIEAVNRRNPDAKTGGEICPDDTVPVLANSPSLQPGAYAMHWGYTLPDGKLLFNARSETAAEKAIFKDGMAHRRCLIPATCYFEWEHRGKDKIKYAIALANNDMFYLAGIYLSCGQLPQGRQSRRLHYPDPRTGGEHRIYSQPDAGYSARRGHRRLAQRAVCCYRCAESRADGHGIQTRVKFPAGRSCFRLFPAFSIYLRIDSTRRSAKREIPYNF